MKPQTELPLCWRRPKYLNRYSGFQFAHSSLGVDEHKKGNAGLTQNDWTGYGASQKSGTHILCLDVHGKVGIRNS